MVIDHLPSSYRVCIYGDGDGVLYDRELLFEELTPEQQERVKQVLEDGHVQDPHDAYAEVAQ